MRRLIVLAFLLSCTQKETITINWENGKAVSIYVPDSVSVYLKNSEFPVLGEFNEGTFTPAVPFQPGATYFAVSKYDTSLFTISTAVHIVPTLLETYPSCDTIPSNLLKVYLRFSEPMMEMRSGQFVMLFDVNGDTIEDAFLDLKPELWNEDGTILTLWIDPGRVKQDLIPNKTLGAVLEDNHSYKLEVAKGWKSKTGVATTNDYSRIFITSTRDETKPDIKTWTVDVRNDTVFVNAKETLDWMLLTTSVSIWKDDLMIEAKSVSEVCEQHLIIIPNRHLTRGEYVLKVDAVLEDQSGNNLNRLFETDVTDQSNKPGDKDFYQLKFKVN